jgi:hypothetical protein
MKKILNNLGILLMLLVLVTACQDDDKSFGSLDGPTNIEFNYEIVGVDAENPNGDGSGNVVLKASADNAISFKYIFEDLSNVTVSGGQYTKRFTKNGVNSYQVTVVALGKGGVASSASFTVEGVLSNFSDPETIELLTNGATKTWYWAAAVPGHLGVGPNNSDLGANRVPGYYAAAPFEKEASADTNCLYDNELTFTKDGEILKYTLNNFGKTFFNASYVVQFGGAAGSDHCLDYNTGGEKIVTLGPSSSLVSDEFKTGTEMSFTDGGFMGYYINATTYDILSITENQMVIRAVPGNDPGLAWYFIYSSQPPVQGGGGEPEPDYTNLVWADEFDVDGAPNTANWGYNIGIGDNGWGNNESQYYTSRPENVIVQGGFLKITAKAESYMGSNYTSARLVSENKYEFTYGKVEWRAKLPTGGGTWPALWMLGQNYQANPWPACGEIDVMEHKGNVPNTIHSTLHYPGNSGGNGNTATTTAANVGGEFHVYRVVWSPNSIKFSIDDQPAFHTVANSASTPFNLDFFLIMNVAMGGTFGGTIAPNFSQSSMEVDYVRVYQ